MLEYLWMARNFSMSLDAQSAAASAKSSASNALGQAEEMVHRLGAIELAVETLVRIGVEKGTYTEEEFFALARKIDAEDGFVDGRRDMRRMRRMCPACEKPNAATKAKCLWCGTSLSEARPVPPE